MTHAGQCPDHMVQARSELVDDLTNNNGKAQRVVDPAVIERCYRILSTLAIELWYYSIRVIIGGNESIEFRAKIVDVLVRPRDLCEASVHWV